MNNLNPPCKERLNVPMITLSFHDRHNETAMFPVLGKADSRRFEI